MKKYNKNVYVFSAIFLAVCAFMIGTSNYQAKSDLSVPEITSFSESKIEKGALTVEFKSSNTGNSYSYELVNVTTEKVNILGGSNTSYTYQNLASGEYEVQIRACSNANNDYSCSDYSEVKSVVLSEGEVAPGDVVAKLEKTSYKCDGYEKTPGVTVVDSEGKALEKDNDYTITYPSDRRNVGTYTVTVTGINDYSFEKKLKFKIVLGTPYIVRLMPTTNRIDVDTRNIVNFLSDFSGGNQISYKKSSAAKWKTIENRKGYIPKDSSSSAGLKANTKYDIRVRNYAKVNGKTKYGSWSKTMTVKTLPSGSKKNLQLLVVSLDIYSYKYDGKNKKPVLTVTDYDTHATLKRGTDYTATYPSTSKKVGVYTITVKGKGKYAKNFPQYLKYRIIK